MSIERKMRRKNAKKSKKLAEKDVAAKVALFGKLPDNCLTCDEPFDKMDKEQVMSWNVVVRQEEEKVHLYCPTCWENAKKVIEELKQRLKEKNERQES